MSDVFISWGSPDRAAVEHLCSRLRDLGVDFFQYNRDMDPGDPIAQRVAAEIRKAKVAIVCLSDASAQREWILTEVALLYEAREKETLKAIVPVRTGALAQDQVPKLILANDPNILDLAGEGDAGFEKILRAVRKALSERPPVVLPAMLFAMTAGQFDEMARNPGIRASILEVCRHLGMVDESVDSRELMALLRQRYGDRPEDFAPFGAGRPLVQTLRGSIRQLNSRRIRDGKPPVLDRWITEDFFGMDRQRRETASRLWVRSSPLLVIDSLSAGHPAISEQLRDLSYQQSRMGVVWIPPYTQRTEDLEKKIAQDLGIVRQLGDFFQEWIDRERGEDLPVLWGAFDVAIESSLWHWVYRMCDALAEPRLDEDALDEMKREYGVKIHTGNFYQVPARSSR